jgi:hypothetical protein
MSPETTAHPLIAVADFYAQDERRHNGAWTSFGFDWKDPGHTEPYTWCEVRWYRGTHEIVAVYSTYDPDKLKAELANGRAPEHVLMGLLSTAGPVIGPTGTAGYSASSLGVWLGDRDLAVTETQVRVLGLLSHPLERYWVLRDAMHLEVLDDGLSRLQARIDACEQATRSDVHLHPAWETLAQAWG